MDDRERAGQRRDSLRRRAADREPSPAEKFETACVILEHLETMLDVADAVGFPAEARRLLVRARDEAEAVIRAERFRVVS